MNIKATGLRTRIINEVRRLYHHAEHHGQWERWAEAGMVLARFRSHDERMERTRETINA